MCPRYADCHVLTCTLAMASTSDWVARRIMVAARSTGVALVGAIVFLRGARWAGGCARANTGELQDASALNTIRRDRHMLARG
jgi:hypothetical protein